MNAKELAQKTKEKCGTWAEEHPKTVRMGKAFGNALLRTIMSDTLGATVKAAPAVKDGEVLGADQVKALSGMTTWQLSAIFRGKKVSFATDPETIKALSRLSTWQIDAILHGEE